MVVAAAICIAITMAVSWSTGPHYHGRSLVSWVRQYSESVEGSVSKLEAQRAICAMPRDRVISRLMGFAKEGVDRFDDSGHGGVRDWITQFAVRFNVPDRYLSWLDRPDPNAVALQGFEAMGTNAAAAIPKLVAMGKDHKYAVVAVECLGEIGLPARQFVCAALS